MEQILIIDDDVDMCLLLEKLLVRKGYAVTQIHSGETALRYLEYQQPAMILCDLRLGDMDGITLLKNVKEKNPAIPFVIITAYDDIQMSMSAIKKGAFGYITKPIVTEEILLTVHNGLTHGKSVNTNYKKDTSIPDIKHLTGSTEYFKTVTTQVNLVAPTEYNVLLHGEAGSGKRSLAYEIHKRSARSKMPFITVTNQDLCNVATNVQSAMVDERFEFFEKANGGTVLLHNITPLPADVQMALLKVIRKKRMKGLSADGEMDLDVRIIISSSDFIWNAMLNSSPEQNIFYWLNDFSIELLPLRSRKDDILLFANHFLQQCNDALNKQVLGFSAEVQTVFKNYVWPGNLQELKNVINKAIHQTKTDLIKIDSLPQELYRQKSFGSFA